MKIFFKVQWKNEKPIEELNDFNDIAIRWADELIKSSNEYCELSEASFGLDWEWQAADISDEERNWRQVDPARKIRNHVINKLPVKDEDGTLKLDIIREAMTNYNKAVKNHLLSHGYINPIVPPQYLWILSQKGELVKELGGHDKYQKYREREINSLSHQSTINWLLFTTAVASVICPFIIAIFLTPDSNVSVKSEPKIEINVDNEQLRSVVEKVLKEQETKKKQIGEEKK